MSNKELCPHQWVYTISERTDEKSERCQNKINCKKNESSLYCTTTWVILHGSSGVAVEMPILISSPQKHTNKVSSVLGSWWTPNVTDSPDSPHSHNVMVLFHPPPAWSCLFSFSSPFCGHLSSAWWFHKTSSCWCWENCHSWTPSPEQARLLRWCRTSLH